MGSRDHGDARRAVALLAKSAYLAEKGGTKITLTLADDAATELDADRCLVLVRRAPSQLQAAMASVIETLGGTSGSSKGTGEAPDPYREFCHRAGFPHRNTGHHSHLGEPVAEARLA